MEKPINNLMDWSAAVRLRDNFKCVKCGLQRHVLAHHIKPKEQFPDLAFDVNNGVTLCRKCHHKIHIEECSPNPSLSIGPWTLQDHIGKIGKVGLYSTQGLKFPVIISDLRCLDERLDFLVKPIGGSGEKWSRADYIEIID